MPTKSSRTGADAQGQVQADSCRSQQTRRLVAFATHSGRSVVQKTALQQSRLEGIFFTRFVDASLSHYLSLAGPIIWGAK
jgi:hypothetical protein